MFPNSNIKFIEKRPFMELIEQLTAFGLTRQEATIYITLQTDGELTGYEVAKLTGISRSNTYTALAGLVDKGAAYAMEGTVTKYTPVKFEEFSSNFIRKLERIQKEIILKLPARKKETDGYITIKGDQHILNKLKNMLLEAEYRIYTSVPMDILKFIEEDLITLINRNIKVVILTDQPYNLDGAIIYYTKNITNQIRLIVDSIKVLTGEIEEMQDSTCLYSKNRNLVNIFKEMLQNEITLIELTKTN